MRITVKKKEKKNYKSVKLVVFVLVFILLVNTVPVKVSAAESKEDVYLMYYGNPDYCRLKGAKLPGTSSDLLLYSWYMDSDGQDVLSYIGLAVRKSTQTSVLLRKFRMIKHGIWTHFYLRTLMTLLITT